MAVGKHCYILHKFPGLVRAGLALKGFGSVVDIGFNIYMYKILQLEKSKIVMLSLDLDIQAI
jgi:hypothetical protein